MRTQPGNTARPLNAATPHAGPGISALLMHALRRHPERVAFQTDDAALSYGATDALIGTLQHALLSLGLQHGHRVGILAGNTPQAWCAAMAAQACGMVVSWLNVLGSVDDHRTQLEDFAADLLILDGMTSASGAEKLAADRAGTLRIASLGQPELGPDLLRLAAHAGSASMQTLCAAHDVALINYTGGTTGRGKGVVRDQLNMGEVTRAVIATFELPDAPRFLAVGPISHVTGQMVLPVLLRGGRVRLLNRFSPERVLHTIASEGISATLLVPTMVYALLDEPSLAKHDVSSLETIIYGASPMAPSRLQEGLARFGPVFAQMYGQTEGFPLTYLARQDHGNQPELLGSCGVASIATAIALLDEDGQDVGVGEAGEICARGSHVMLGYLGRDDLTAEALKDGWLHTGDIARRDERGYLWIVDRKKDMIVSGGFNVYPREVEDALASHPAVAEVAVIGVPDAKWGEAVTALVVLRPGASADEASLAEHVRQHKGAVHAPKQVLFKPDLPRTPVGKIDKKALREPFWGDQKRQIN